MYKLLNKLWLGAIIEFTLIVCCWSGGFTLLFRYSLGNSDFYVLDTIRITGIICSVACPFLHIFMWYYIFYTRFKPILDVADLRIAHLCFNLLVLLTIAGMLMFENQSVNTFIYWFTGVSYTVVCSTLELIWVIHKKEELPR
jgi:hypothetical protein